MRRAAALVLAHLRASVALTLQYRVELVGNLVMAVFWTGTAIIPLVVLFAARDQVAGWRWADALVVVACFTLLKGVQGSLIQPSMQQAVQHIRRGTLDFVLLKPVDSQLLISTSRFELKELSDCVAGLGILAVALWHRGEWPGPIALLSFVVLLGCGALILYSIWVLVMSLAFVVVKVDNLTYLFSSLFDAARWPASVYRGALAVVFTFVLPLAVMTTYPALALLERGSAAQLGGALGAAAVFLLLSRAVWQRAVRRYTSAGG